MLCKAMGTEDIRISVTKVYGTTSLVLRLGGVGVKFPEKKHCTTLE